MQATKQALQEAAQRKVMAALYGLQVEFGLEEDDVRDMWEAIKDVAADSDSAICLECAYHVTRCKCYEE